jgi:acyl carrier protein
MPEVTPEMKRQVQSLIVEFFAEECEVDPASVRDDTNIIEDLEGDSLMFLSLLELVKKKYDLDVQLKTLGKYLMKKPAATVGQVVDLTCLIIEHGEGIKDL